MHRAVCPFALSVDKRSTGSTGCTRSRCPKTWDGLWLNADCQWDCRTQGLRERLERVAVKPALNLPMPPALRNHSFENFVVKDFNREAYTVCLKFAANFANHRRQRSADLRESRREANHFSLRCPEFPQRPAYYRVCHIPTLLSCCAGRRRRSSPIAVDLLALDDLGSEREAIGRWKNCW